MQNKHREGPPPEVERDRRVCGCLLLGLSCNEMEEGDEILENIARLRDWHD